MMKKNVLYIGIGLIIAIFIIQLIPYGHEHVNPAINNEPQWSSPETRALAQRACFDCHSNQTTFPWYSNLAPVSWLVASDVIEGRTHINFSDWNRPTEQHADEFQKVFDENSMPPKSYLLLHPAARLSPEEKQKLADGLAKIAKDYEMVMAH